MKGALSFIPLHTLILLLAATGCNGKSDDSDLCDGIDCSGHGTCVTVGGSAACDCEEGYRAVGLTCVEVEEDAEEDGDAPDIEDSTEVPELSEPDDEDDEAFIQEEILEVVDLYDQDDFSEVQDATEDDIAEVEEAVDGLDAEEEEIWECGYSVSRLTSGWDHTCAVTEAGGAICWGDNTWGQLGNGTTIDSTIPVEVAGLSTAVSDISLGYSHTCALLTSGGVKCWGNGGSGKLGNGSTDDSTTPVSRVGHWLRISAYPAAPRRFRA